MRHICFTHIRPPPCFRRLSPLSSSNPLCPRANSPPPPPPPSTSPLSCPALPLPQYELLDEVMDSGFPQFTEAKILSEFIKTDAFRLELSAPKPNIAAVTNAVSWRSEGIRYKKNEVRNERRCGEGKQWKHVHRG